MTQRRRILFVVTDEPHGISGGAISQMGRTADIAASEFDVAFAVAGNPSSAPVAARLPLPGASERVVRRIFESMSTVVSRAGIKSLAAITREFQPDMVIFDGLDVAPYGRAIFPNESLRVLHLSRPLMANGTAPGSRAAARIARSFDRVAVPSHAEATVLSAEARIPDVRVLPFAPGETWDGGAPDLAGQHVFFFLGDGEPTRAKAAMALLNTVVAQARKRGSRIVVYCSGPDTSRFQNLSPLGSDRPSELLMLTRGIVLLAVGNSATTTASLTQAMASGVPVIAEPGAIARMSAVPGISAVTAWGIDGFRYALEMAGSDPDRLAKIGLAGQTVAKSVGAPAAILSHLSALFASPTPRRLSRVGNRLRRDPTATPTDYFRD